MVVFQKGKIVDTPYQIYRGDDPELQEIPVPRTVDYFDSLPSFEARMKNAFKFGFFVGSITGVSDIAYHTKIRDRRAQLIRFAYFTVPIVAGTTGFVGGLEITKKYTNNRYAAYAAACAVPAGVYATFWRQWTRFPKAFTLFAGFAMTYNYMVEENFYTGLYGGNPNDPRGFLHKDTSIFRWPHRVEFARNREIVEDKLMGHDPGHYHKRFTGEGEANHIDLTRQTLR